MVPDSDPIPGPGQPESCPSSGSTLAYRSSAGSTVSIGDSGYGSIPTDENTDDGSQTTPVGTPSLSTEPGFPTSQIRQRMFDGLFVFNPDAEQVRRYNEIVNYITPSLNHFIQKGGKLLSSGRSKPKRVNAVRLIVMGPDLLEINAKPHIVFFCSRGVERPMRELLERPSYKQLLQPDGATALAFSYRIVPSGTNISLRFFTSEFSAEIPDLKLSTSKGSVETHCGTPIRLYNGDSREWRRTTLGGVLEITDDTGSAQCYAMTTGHQLDGWSDEESEHWEDGVARSAEDDGTAWDFKECKRYGNVVTAVSGSVLSFTDTYPGIKTYLDWALFKFEFTKPNAVVENDSVVKLSDLIQLPDLSDSRPLADQVKILSASAGIIMGVILAGMTKIAIDPGEEVIDAYVVSLDQDNAICDGDSGSWVVSLDNNQLVGHVVASDILGDVYVIPLSATLSDIQSRVQASSICLPSAHGHTHISGTDGREMESLREEQPIMRAMSPHTGLISKVGKVNRFARLLSRRANGVISALPDTLAGIMSLTNVLKHLQSEVEDPGSFLYSTVERARGYNRQLSIALDECLQTMDHINMILDRLETTWSLVTNNNSMEQDNMQNPGNDGATKGDIVTVSQQSVWTSQTSYTPSKLPESKGQNAPTSSIPTTLLQEVTEEVGNKLSAQTTNIDILLDTVQLNYYNSVTDKTQTLPQSELDVIIDKVDKVAIRMWRHKRLGKPLTDIAVGDDEKETPWLEFRKELVKEGFSEHVLDQNKDVLRAYVRELELGGWGVEKHIISLRKFHPQWWPATDTDMSLSSRPSRSSNSSLTSRRSHRTATSRSSYTSISSDHGATTDNQRTEYAAFISTNGLLDIDSSEDERWSSSFPTVPPMKSSNLPRIRKMAPDEHGNDIPSDAIWTKISRRIVSPEILERAAVRYEARPKFVAVLGVVNKETIIKWARHSAEIRHSRHPDPDLQAWDSDLDAWGLRESDSSDEDGGIPRAENNQDLKMAENIDASYGLDRAAPPRRDQDRDRAAPPRRDRDREGDRDRSRDKYRSRRRDGNRDRDRDYDSSSRVAQKKTEVRELLGAVGIGGAAATLLSVLTEAAQHL